MAHQKNSLTPEQERLIDKAVESIERLRTLAQSCRKAKLHQLAGFYARIADDLSQVAESQINELRWNKLPANWSTEEKQKALGLIDGEKE